MPDYSQFVMIALIIAGGYFLMVRPQQKRQAEQQKAVSAIETGSRVLTTSGVLATVIHLGERHAVIEIAPGVEMTVLKAALLRVLKPDEEEFEYADDAEDVAASSVDDGFGAAIAGFHAPDAADPQSLDKAGEPTDPADDGTDVEPLSHPDQQK